jgi:hypothetical protein
MRRGALDRSRRFAEPWCWRWLDNVINFDESLPRDIVRVLGGLVQIQDGCKADIGSFKQGAPFRP